MFSIPDSRHAGFERVAKTDHDKKKTRKDFSMKPVVEFSREKWTRSCLEGKSVEVVFNHLFANRCLLESANDKCRHATKMPIDPSFVDALYCCAFLTQCEVKKPTLEVKLCDNNLLIGQLVSRGNNTRKDQFTISWNGYACALYDGQIYLYQADAEHSSIMCQCNGQTTLICGSQLVCGEWPWVLVVKSIKTKS